MVESGESGQGASCPCSLAMCEPGCLCQEPGCAQWPSPTPYLARTCLYMYTALLYSTLYTPYTHHTHILLNIIIGVCNKCIIKVPIAMPCNNATNQQTQKCIAVSTFKLLIWSMIITILYLSYSMYVNISFLNMIQYFIDAIHKLMLDHINK